MAIQTTGEQPSSDEQVDNVVARWEAYEINLEDVGGSDQIAKFMIGDEPVLLAGLPQEFLRKIAKHLYEDVHLEIVVRISL